MPPKDLALFSYISILVSKREKIGPPTNPATVFPQKFLSFLRYNLFVGVNEMHVENITVTVSVRLVLRLGSV